MPTETLTILLVEDNLTDACWVQGRLQDVEAFSFQLIRVSQLEDALNCLTQIPSISVILLNWPLSDAHGEGIVRQLLAVSPDIPVVVISRWRDEAIALQALQHGAQDYLVENQVDGQQLVRAIRYAIARQKANVPAVGQPLPQKPLEPAEPLVQERTQDLANQAGNVQLAINLTRDITQRKCIEEVLLKHDRLLAGVSAAMTQLLTATDYQAAMRQALTVLSVATDVDRVYIFENQIQETTGEKLTSQRFKWSREQLAVRDHAKLQTISYEIDLPRWYQRLAAGQAVKGLVRDFPQVEREILQPHHIRSILVVPVMMEGRFWGFIGFADCQRERQWTDHEESLLTIAAGSLGSAMVRADREEALRESETKFRTLYESTSAAVILLDETVICDGNSAALQMFGCTEREQLCGKSIDQFSPLVQPKGKNSVQLAQQYMARAIAQGSCRFDWIYRKRTGEEFPAEVTLTRIELGNRKVLQAVIYDISDRKATEMQLLQAKEAAEAGSRAKSEFLATISHELRTPLNAVLGLSQLLRQEIHGTLNEQQKEYIRCIHSSGEHLLALINDILDLSKVEAGKEQLAFAPIDIQQLCEYCFALVREQANERGLKLTLRIAPEARLLIADERRCKQMLLNLLSNAVKFTLVGEVALIVTKQAKGICFTVQDTGIGIATEQLPLLFEPFRQLDSGLNRQFPGTGLGLALTRSLARLHGGDVSVESTLGQGSAFTLCLPDCLLEERMLSSSLQVPGMIEGESCPLWAKFRILLVETDKRSALVLKDYLQVIGHRVEHLTDGKDFVQKVRTFKPNLILMDVQLQEDCTGLDLLAVLRREPDTKNLKVVMMTSTARAGEGDSYSLDTTASRLSATASCLNANSNGGRTLFAQSGRSLKASRECCLEAGADDCLIKPIGIAQLEAVLMRYL